MRTLSAIRWVSSGGYAWTLDYIDGSSTHYHTDKDCRGLWEDGIQVLALDELDLHGMTAATRRHHVDAYHNEARQIRSWIPGGARRARARYTPAPGLGLGPRP